MNVAQLRPLLLFCYFLFFFWFSGLQNHLFCCLFVLFPPNSDNGPTAFPQCRHVESHSSDFVVFKVLSLCPSKKQGTHTCAHTVIFFIFFLLCSATVKMSPSNNNSVVEKLYFGKKKKKKKKKKLAQHVKSSCPEAVLLDMYL